MKGVLLAGGRGRRLAPITHTMSKHLVPVANRPVLTYGLEAIAAAGIEEVAVVVGEKSREEIEALVGDGSAYGVRATFVHQPAPRGIADAVARTREFVGASDVLVYLGDNLLGGPIDGFVRSFENARDDARLLVKELSRLDSLGVAEVTHDGRVAAVSEKPAEPGSPWGLLGVYAFSPAVFDAIDQLPPAPEDELEVTEAIQAMLDAGASVGSQEFDGWWVDVGRPGSVLTANRQVLAERAPDDASVTVPPDDASDPGPTIHEPVSITDDATVGPDVHLGPYASIGPGATVERGRIENSVVMADATVSTATPIHDSVVGREAVVDIERRNGEEPLRMVLGEDSRVVD